jgi:putative SOS response-associated peptidase YedK
MCGRYAIINTIEEISGHYHAPSQSNALLPNYNVSTGDSVPVLIHLDITKITSMIFGFTASWSDKPSYVINARAEGDYNKENNRNYSGPPGIISKPMFRGAIRTHRCAIPFNGFYEGPEREKLNKPYYIYPANGGILSFAGIYSEWKNPVTQHIQHYFAIITTVASNITAAIGHHRSPLILPAGSEGHWVHPQTPLSEITELLLSCSDTVLQAHPVSVAIKSPLNKTESCIHSIGNIITNETPKVHISEQLNLFGMGMTTSRNRRNRE